MPTFKYVSTALQHEKATIATSEWYADYLRVLPVQLFITIRPLGRSTMEYMRQVEKEFVGAVEVYYRAPLSYLINYEHIPYPHLHLHVACPYSLNKGVIETLLKRLRVDFLVQEYDSTKGDSWNYTLKEMNFSPLAEFDIVSCDYYLKAPANRKDRKRAARHLLRLEQNKK